MPEPLVEQSPAGINRPAASATTPFRMVSVIIPARNEGKVIGSLVRSVLAQCPEGTDIEVVVVDDGSTDNTQDEAERSGARVVRLSSEESGNPAAARNRGAQASKGDPIVFLDADCTPHEGWLRALLDTHLEQGVSVVGGSLELPPGLPFSARCDYYCGWYHAHPEMRSGFSLHHPPCNLSVRRDDFLATSGYETKQPIAYSHEELLWQSELRRSDKKIYFNTDAIVDHHNRPGLGNLLRRNYRWGYGAIEAKASSGNARFAALYRYPWLLVLATIPLAPLTTAYILALWLRAGKLEIIPVLPVLLAARIAYSAGMAVGGYGWLKGGRSSSNDRRPRWE